MIKHIRFIDIPLTQAHLKEIQFQLNPGGENQITYQSGVTNRW
jgi:hypothetical protein